MTTQPAPTENTSTTTELEHIACCIAPVGEMSPSLCGNLELVEPDDGEPWEPSCVVCIDLARTNHCPHGVCLEAAECTRGRA